MDLLDRIDKLIPESVYGKQKSKDWFKYRGLIAGVKSKKELSKLLNQIVKDVSASELQDLTNQAIARMGKLS